MSSDTQKTTEAVNGIAFLLLTEAFLDYVEMFAAIDPAVGHAQLVEAKDRAAETLARFAAERPEAGGSEVLVAAAVRVNSVFDRALSLNGTPE